MPNIMGGGKAATLRLRLNVSQLTCITRLIFHITHLRPDSGVGFQVEDHQTFQVKVHKIFPGKSPQSLGFQVKVHETIKPFRVFHLRSTADREVTRLAGRERAHAPGPDGLTFAELARQR